MTPRNDHKKGSWPKLSIPWHRSIVMRAAGVASLFFLLGYIISVYIGIQSIKAVSKLAYDKEIEQSLALQLSQIKKSHSLMQQVIIERIKPKVRTILEQTPPFLDTKTTKNIVFQAVADLDVVTEKLVFDQMSAEVLEPHIKSPVSWKGRNTLFILNHTVAFPKGESYRAFKAAETIQQRYQLVGAGLDNNILPTLIQANTIVLLSGFTLLIIAFFLMARKFRHNIQTLLQGFEKWSGEDFSFRFEGVQSGELGLITQQFNAMAGDVETNRQKSLYLEKIASWQVIARKLAHEIKNPLTPIQMMVSQLGRHYKGDDEKFGKLLNDAQTIITEEVAGLRRMVDNFSDFARLPVPTLSLVDLGKSASHVTGLQQAAYEHHTIQFNGTEDGEPAMAMVDDGLIKQVLLNLVKNAAEACTDPAIITIRIEDDLTHWVLHVEDNGPGIPEEIRKRIFEAYFTTKHTGPTPGMGLGLAICQKIILDHNGEVSVSSRKGCTIFSVRLPKGAEASEYGN